MREVYIYIYTHVYTFGSLPTHKVYKNISSNKSKLIFADNTFVYGKLSDWCICNSDLDGRMSSWQEESESYQEAEKRKLELYKASHPLFYTESERN